MPQSSRSISLASIMPRRTSCCMWSARPVFAKRRALGGGCSPDGNGGKLLRDLKRRIYRHANLKISQPYKSKTAARQYSNSIIPNELGT